MSHIAHNPNIYTVFCHKISKETRKYSFLRWNQRIFTKKSKKETFIVKQLEIYVLAGNQTINPSRAGNKPLMQLYRSRQ